MLIMKRYMQMKNKQWLACAMGCVLLGGSLNGMADNMHFANDQALRGLAKAKQQQVLQQEDIQAELSNIQQQVSALKGAVTSVNVLSGTRKSGTQKGAMTSANLLAYSSAKSSAADRVKSIRQTLRQSKLIKEDPALAHALLVKLRLLNETLTQNPAEFNTRLSTANADSVSDMSMQVDSITRMVNQATAL